MGRNVVTMNILLTRRSRTSSIHAMFGVKRVSTEISTPAVAAWKSDANWSLAGGGTWGPTQTPYLHKCMDAEKAKLE